MNQSKKTDFGQNQKNWLWSRVRIILQWCLHCLTLHVLQMVNSLCTTCLQEYHPGCLLTNYRLLTGPSGLSNNMKLFTAPICNINSLFHLFFQSYRKDNPGSFPEGALVYFLQGFWHLSQQTGLWCVHSQVWIGASFQQKIEYSMNIKH